MTQEEIIKGNKLIAEFMEKDISAIIPDRFDISTPYHDDWGWLMPVVDKIEYFGFSITQKNDSCGIENTHHRPHYRNYIVSDVDKQDATYKIVVEFINWYNKNKKS